MGFEWRAESIGSVMILDGEVVGSVWKVADEWWGMAGNAGAHPHPTQAAARRQVEKDVVKQKERR